MLVKAVMTTLGPIKSGYRVVQACGRVCLSTLCLSLPIVGTAAAIRAGTVARGGETAEISRKFQRWVGIMACKWPGWACMLAPYTTIIYIHLLEVLTAPGAVSDMCRTVRTRPAGAQAASESVRKVFNGVFRWAGCWVLPRGA